MSGVHETGPVPQRCRGRSGSAMVAALVFLFAFTSAGVVWLSRDVNRAVSNRSAAQSIAFQAARAGAQQVDVASVRQRGRDGVVVAADGSRGAVDAGEAHADALLRAFGVDGSATVVVRGAAVTVTVTVADPAGDQTATATVEARTGP